jgi:hypothetical protein
MDQENNETTTDTTHDENMLQEKRKNKTKVRLNSRTAASYTIDSIYQGGLDVVTILEELNNGIAQIKNGDLQEIETMLLTQAITLNIFFHRCLSQAADQQWIPQIQTFSDLALRAQKEARKTLTVLAQIKNPKLATFIKQQNNAVNQQVNNQVKSENKNISSNELLEVKDEQRLDCGASIASISINPPVEAVEISGS